MYKLILKCRVITPMFMAGGDGRTPELRPSEFKGMMRWWWRAIRAEEDIKKLREEECKIFGGTGEGMGKSKIKITVRPERISYGDNVRDEIMNYEGLKYL
ncbi:MAG: type III-B CRISPR module RAMP protein Cmr1, partial [candidate division WOR-3 bacterium]